MGWAFLPQKNKSNTIILSLPNSTVNAKRGNALRILYCTSGQVAEFVW
jgi:P pilus assembly chaperone PapD